MASTTMTPTKRLLFGVMLTALGAATLYLCRPMSVAAQSPRVYELRTYHCAPGRLEALKTRFRHPTTMLFEKHGMKNVGYWPPADAPASADTLIYIISHES